MEALPHFDLQKILSGLNGGSSNRSALPISQPSNAEVVGFNLPKQEITVKRPVSRATAEKEDRPATPLPDPSVITTWPAALKFVTRYIVTNEKASARIRHLISQQREHERQWWTARQELVSKQQARSGNQRQVMELLKSLGGSVSTVSTEADPKTEQTELEAFDQKIHVGLTKMAADFDRQLRMVGVPFFAVKHELVILEEVASQNSISGRLDRGELRELQRRILQTLEDLLLD